MSLFSRLQNGDPDAGHAKIAVWGLLNDMSLLLDGDCVFADIVSRHVLSSDEQAELLSVLTAVQTQITDGTTRQDVFHTAWHTLVAVERGVISESRAYERLGVS